MEVKYRKRPVEVEAVKFLDTVASFKKCKAFVGDGLYYDYQNAPRVFIHTEEGEMGVSKGDYIIKGVKGEFYPCKPDIFRETYEKVDPPKKWPKSPCCHKTLLGFHADTYPYETGYECSCCGIEWSDLQISRGALQEPCEPSGRCTCIWGKNPKKKRAYSSEYGSHKKWVKSAGRYIHFCNKCGEHVTKDTGCSNPMCPEPIKDFDPETGKVS